MYEYIPFLADLNVAGLAFALEVLVGVLAGNLVEGSKSGAGVNGLLVELRGGKGSRCRAGKNSRKGKGGWKMHDGRVLISSEDIDLRCWRDEGHTDKGKINRQTIFSTLYMFPITLLGPTLFAILHAFLQRLFSSRTRSTASSDSERVREPLCRHFHCMIPRFSNCKRHTVPTYREAVVPILPSWKRLYPMFS